jgi:hypothetical protein
MKALNKFRLKNLKRVNVPLGAGSKNFNLSLVLYPITLFQKQESKIKFERQKPKNLCFDAHCTYQDLSSCTNYTFEAKLFYGGKPMKNPKNGEEIKSFTKEFTTRPNETESTHIKHLGSTKQSLIFSIEGNSTLFPLTKYHTYFLWTDPETFTSFLP